MAFLPAGLLGQGLPASETGSYSECVKYTFRPLAGSIGMRLSSRSHDKKLTRPKAWSWGVTHDINLPLASTCTACVSRVSPVGVVGCAHSEALARQIARPASFRHAASRLRGWAGVEFIMAMSSGCRRCVPQISDASAWRSRESTTMIFFIRD